MDAFYQVSEGYIVAFAARPYVYLTTVFSLLLINLLALEWLWRLCWATVEQPRPLRHPTTALRITLILLLVSAILRAAPDTVLLMGWSEMTTESRHFWAAADNLLDAVSVFPFTLSWLVALLGGAMIVHQLENKPLPLHLWPTWTQLGRPLKIGVGVLAIASALTIFQ
jgi:hypothetical protein